MGETMYIKKIEGPRAVALPGGRIMTRADLPEPNTKRWVASRKAAVVRAIVCGLITEKQACEMYDLSAEELASWSQAILQHGEVALKATQLQKYRQL